jgi:hypothetical protein
MGKMQVRNYCMGRLNWPSVHSELHLIYKITEFVMYEFNKQME